ncbi:hypothetical protein B0T24DRAFT_419024 [Lasiosphaeria ovina]|uniref:Uncharacterized protein n=1 Tax=Lasiosphaeria ovina TaxID=92902 RepID=A0AAE0JW11_9PEZI|nr:hypothetical protein B0T24DRAFT_419024 [Lasiosphaeria ovina]
MQEEHMSDLNYRLRQKALDDVVAVAGSSKQSPRRAHWRARAASREHVARTRNDQGRARCAAQRSARSPRCCRTGSTCTSVTRTWTRNLARRRKPPRRRLLLSLLRASRALPRRVLLAAAPRSGLPRAPWNLTCRLRPSGRDSQCRRRRRRRRRRISRPLWAPRAFGGTSRRRLSEEGMEARRLCQPSVTWVVGMDGQWLVGKREGELGKGGLGTGRGGTGKGEEGKGENGNWGRGDWTIRKGEREKGRGR